MQTTLDQILAFEAVEIAFQRSLTAPEHDIIDLVVLQIAERGGVAVPAREEVLVDAQHLRTERADPFARRAA